MARPHKKRRICEIPETRVFKPAGTPIKKNEIIELQIDELEAMRLANLEGLYQEQAAERMNTSRATYGRILVEGRRKVTDALVNGKTLVIGGGNVDLCPQAKSRCCACGAEMPKVEMQECAECGGKLVTSCNCSSQECELLSKDDQ